MTKKARYQSTRSMPAPYQGKLREISLFRVEAGYASIFKCLIELSTAVTCISTCIA